MVTVRRNSRVGIDVTKLIGYFFVGGTCFLVDFAIFYWLAKIQGYNYLFVNALSFSIATTINYLLCIFFIFKSGLKYNKKTELLLVFLVGGFCLAVNQVLLYAFIGLLGFEMLFAKATAVALTFLLNYFGRSVFVFSHNK